MTAAAVELGTDAQRLLRTRPRGHSWAQRVDRRKHCVVVRVEGELDAAVFPEFHVVFERAMLTDCHAVVVDLRATRFLSLRAAATLGTARQQCAAGGPDLRIVAGRREVERALAAVGVRDMFEDFPSMRAALDS
jgi:anti-sigma B factor antagonist